MDLVGIACFTAVAETGNFTRAARRCGMSQPALTRALRPMLRQAAQPLFVRWRNDVRLTDAGLRLLWSLRARAAA